MIDILFAFYTSIIFLFLAQGLLTAWLSLYIWESPERIKKVASPDNYIEPKMSFSVLLPARHEKDVIGETIFSIYKSNYPKDLIEILIICEANDISTIQAAKDVIRTNFISNAKIVTFNNKPINKPNGLNNGLMVATKEISVIFDAEDSVNPDIFNIANTLYIKKNPDIIQAGVQLMNYDTNWFSTHNVLEYYFWLDQECISIQN